MTVVEPVTNRVAPRQLTFHVKPSGPEAVVGADGWSVHGSLMASNDDGNVPRETSRRPCVVSHTDGVLLTAVFLFNPWPTARSRKCVACRPRVERRDLRDTARVCRRRWNAATAGGRFTWNIPGVRLPVINGQPARNRRTTGTRLDGSFPVIGQS